MLDLEKLKKFVKDTESNLNAEVIERLKSKKPHTHKNLENKIDYSLRNVFTDFDERKFLGLLESNPELFVKNKKHFQGPFEKAMSVFNKARNYIEHHGNDYNGVLAAVESGGKHNAVKKSGKYIGKHQMDYNALEAAGFMWEDKHGHHHWTKLAKSHGVHSRKDFLNNEHAQDVAMERYTEENWKYAIRKGLHHYVGSEIFGIKISENGIKAAGHLIGMGSLASALNNNKQKYDGNGVSFLMSMAIGGLTQKQNIYDTQIYRPIDHKIGFNLEKSILDSFANQNYDMAYAPDKLSVMNNSKKRM